MTRCFLMKNVKSFVESWEMLENEAALYAENDSFDAADDTQRRADVLKKEIDFYKKYLKPATQD